MMKTGIKMSLVKVLKASELVEGQVRGVLAGSRRLALARVGGKIYCLDNTCAHAGGPLGEGKVEGSAVVCPWHGFGFDVKTGVSPMNSELKVPIYKVVVKGGDVFVDV